MRRRLFGLLAIASAPALVACNDHAGELRAKQVEERGELVGGPVAMADVGDFLLENDKIKVNILGPRDSPGPGVFGGSIVDVDVKRDRLDTSNDAQGHDRFAELFPVANLLVPDPAATEVTVLADGSDGSEAAIRVEGDGAFLFEALEILKTEQAVLGALFAPVKASVHFQTDYIVHPGDKHVDIKTIITDTDDGVSCTSSDCSPLALDRFSEPSSVFGGILGDAKSSPTKKSEAGIIAGDFVFFGNQDDVFAPGFGFDEEKAVNDAFNVGQNTFVDPLSLDWVAASGGDVSYGYVNAPALSGKQSVVDVPLITSAATAFLIAGKNCSFDASDDDACDGKTSWSYERYLLVGDGDVASVADEVHRIRGDAVGTVKGVVSWLSTGQPAANARVFLFRDPDPSVSFASIDDLAEANTKKGGDVGLLDSIDADVGLDPVEDGDFQATVPPGEYVVVAEDAKGVALSTPTHLAINAGETVVVDPMLPLPSTVEYRVSDETGALTPSKITFVALDDSGAPLEGDGKRRVYTGGSRFSSGVRQVEITASGEGQVDVEPGRYRIIASRGPEYSNDVVNDVTLASGQVFQFDASVAHEVDTSGYLSADMHLHQTASFDSGMDLNLRVATIAAEDVELAVATDHDVETDLSPYLFQDNLTSYVKSVISSETTTLEQGHFIAWPEGYDANDVPVHGSHDWTCESGDEILDALHQKSDGEHGELVIIPHPRDGFFGYIDQLGVDPLDLSRKTGMLEATNPLFETAGCDFDAMEIINSKRYDLVRTATVSEAADYNRCRKRIDAATTVDEVAKACPELSNDLLAPCTSDERIALCRDRNRAALAREMTKRILKRTPSEQLANWTFDKTVSESEDLCDLKKLGTNPVPAANAELPCEFHIGQVDDYFRYLEHGFVKTMVASSDSHDLHIEPGSPRTWFASSTDAPLGLDLNDAIASFKSHNAVASYGPFVRASVDGKTFGEVASATPGGKIDLALHVETASWFGVDRVEIYMNGALVKELAPSVDPGRIVDVDRTVTLDVPTRDSWIVIIAMGLDDRDLMTPVSLGVQYGEIQLSTVAASAFADVPALSAIFPITPALPDFYPVIPYAVTNAIFLDTDENGVYDAPLPGLPPFCSLPCVDSTTCPTGQTCLDDKKVCGFAVSGSCDHRRMPFGD